MLGRNFKTAKILSRNFSGSCLRNAIEIKMPALSPTMTEGTIISWSKSEGDEVAAGDVLCEIQTDKAVLPLEVDEEGILAKILAPANSTDVKIGTPIAMIAEEGEDWKSISGPVLESGSAVTDEKPLKDEAAAEFSSVRHLGATPTLIGPAVRGLLEQYNINANEVRPTGPKSLLLKGDILKYVKEKGLKPVVLTDKGPVESEQQQPKVSVMPNKFVMAPVSRKEVESQAKAMKKQQSPYKPGLVSDFVDLELTNVRKVIAKRLTESKGTIPHAYSVIQCPLDEVLELRKSLKKDGIAVSVNDFIIKASACALESVPEVNVTMVQGQVRHESSVDISIAVATDNGLITPIVKGAAGLGIQAISATVKELATRARANKLKPHEFQGGSFSISNLGMYGISEFSAIINPPQCAILAIGSGSLKLDASGKPINVVSVTLSYNSEAISEDSAANFLDSFKTYLSQPAFLLLGGFKTKSQAVSI
ncbi:pyruvate dehydrogenase protein X component, mitochondrial-like isoform X1 [Artemia franciscana]